ncbi:MAG: bifunctional precorrin-2 dehydrogenase/sirohydrochlorin ferrochelatase [Lentisphaeria bacterium]|nr:bifunctional precorrin-2 dehydrogenase/sirohydrochlorin ferrochelatase [Lentisphaeria bacterium]
MKYLPVNLDVKGRRVLVIGGGSVACRKVKSLRECGAEITVVSPAFCSALARMKGITRIRRGYRKTDTRGMWLVISAAGPQEVNRRACRHAREAGIPINVVDQPELCSFIVPAVLRRGSVLVTVSTGGGCPALAGRIRDLLAAVVGPEFGLHAALLRRMRTRVKASGLSLEGRSRLLKAMAADAVREMIRTQGAAAARAHLLRLLAEAEAEHAKPEAPEGRGPPGEGVGRTGETAGARRPRR